MELEKCHIKRKDCEKVCKNCKNMYLCSPYGGTCKKREIIRWFNQIIHNTKKT